MSICSQDTLDESPTSVPPATAANATIAQVPDPAPTTVPVATAGAADPRIAHHLIPRIDAECSRAGLAISQGWALQNLGFLALERGDVVHALAWATESLPIYRHAFSREHLADGLMIVASAAAALGQPTRAAQLFGARAAIREVLGEVADLVLPAPPLPASDIYTRARVAAQAAPVSARTVLGETAFAVAWEQGNALPLEQVAPSAGTQ